MLKKKLIFSFSIFYLFVAIPTSYACRFWVGVGKTIPAEHTQKQLLFESKSLKFLGNEYKDGWTVGFYDSKEAVVLRGSKRADLDLQYDKAVNYVAQKTPQIVLGHLRRASSGCVKGVPNPHPFERFLNGKNWLFGHNGGMDKQILFDLIGEQHLYENPPLVCTDNPPQSWIDSELYFIYLLKKIEESNWNVVVGLKKGLEEIYSVIEDDKRYLNFFLSDGKTVWVFRKGHSLHYLYDKEKGISSVASTVPTAVRGEWRTFPEDTIGMLRVNQPIRFIFLSNDVINREVSDEEYILREFQKARVDKYKTEELIRFIYRKYIKGQEQPTGFIAIHYASLMGIRAKFVFDPFRKALFLKQSVNLLDKVVKDHKGDLIVHYIRYVTLYRMPSFLYGIGGKKTEDVPTICDLLLKRDYSKVDRDKQFQMTQLMLERAPLSLEHRIGIKRLLKELSKENQGLF